MTNAIILSIGYWVLVTFQFVALILIMRYFNQERRELRKVNAQLHDRLMAKNFGDYSAGVRMQKKPMTDVEVMEKLYDITEEDKIQADRLSVA